MRKIIFLLFCVLCLSFSLNAIASPIVPETKPLEKEEHDYLCQAIALTVLKEKPNIKSFNSFDIRSDGALLLGSDDPQKMVITYTQAGTFWFGFSFRCSGDFCVKWDDNGHVILYLVRSDALLTLDHTGNVLSITGSISNNVENAEYVRKEMQPQKRTINGMTYCMKKEDGVLGVFSSAYSELVRTDEAGREQSLLDLRSEHRFSVIVFFVFLIVFLALLTLIIFQNVKKRNITF